MSTKPVEGVTVTLSGDASDSVQTNASGEYSFTLPNGDYAVTPAKAGYEFTPAAENVTIADGDDTDNDFTGAEIYTISGTIVDGAAAGIEGVTVALTGDATDSTTTAADGTYSFTGVVDGSYTVTPTLAGYGFTPASRAANVSGGNVAVDNMVGAPAVPVEGWVNWESGTYLYGVSNPTRASSTIIKPRDPYPANAVDTNAVLANAYGFNFHVASSAISGSSRAISMRHTSVVYPGLTYIGWGANGLQMDRVNGFRLLSVLGSQAWSGSTYYGNDHFMAAVCVADGFEADGTPNTYVGFGVTGWTSADINPDQVFVRTRLEGAGVVTSATVNLSWNTANWVMPYAIGIIFPPGGSGNVGAYARALGFTAANTPYTTTNFSALPAGFVNKVFDGVYQYNRSGSTNGGPIANYGFWYGAYGSAWPSFPTS